ncbi:hypothetical protein [Methanolapillus ohkumae]|uniref:Uncharacterized protein n=1 Tax=Methanolapillus ohkumae TaxID=3028298 RepID=A0AA96ZW26_9EURY|nr:hypothetical protein MsAm2_13320 [Methanosarcinaceae archaeon Am2]
MQLKIALFIVGMAFLQFLSYYFSEFRSVYTLIGGLVSTFFVGTVVSTIIGTYAGRITKNQYKNKYYVVNVFGFKFSISAFMILTFMLTVVSMTIIYYFSDIDSYMSSLHLFGK